MGCKLTLRIEPPVLLQQVDAGQFKVPDGFGQFQGYFSFNPGKSFPLLNGANYFPYFLVFQVQQTFQPVDTIELPVQTFPLNWREEDGSGRKAPSQDFPFRSKIVPLVRQNGDQVLTLFQNFGF